MEDNKTKVGTLKYFINLGFFLYFFILFGERLASLILSFVNRVNIFSGYFNIFTYFVTFLSLIVFIVFLFAKCRNHFKGLFSRKLEVYEKISFVDLTICSGILLFSGMVHTEYTIAPIQFASYAFLILSILFKTIEINKKCDDKPMLWFSFIYLVCYAMAIPVMYPCKGNLVFACYVAESAAVLLLVTVFTLLTIKVFKGEGTSLFGIIPFVILVALSGSVIILRWPHEGNLFVLIFLIASILLYIISPIYLLLKRRH